MTHSHMTQWIEDADARQFRQSASWNEGLAATESHYLHVGKTIAKVSSLLRRSMSRQSNVGWHAFAYVRHPLKRSGHTYIVKGTI
jgi:hypothetical protein